jgi:hypothetical protein
LKSRDDAPLVFDAKTHFDIRREMYFHIAKRRDAIGLSSSPVQCLLLGEGTRGPLFPRNFPVETTSSGSWNTIVNSAQRLDIRRPAFLDGSLRVCNDSRGGQLLQRRLLAVPSRGDMPATWTGAFQKFPLGTSRAPSR